MIKVKFLANLTPLPNITCFNLSSRVMNELASDAMLGTCYFILVYQRNINKIFCERLKVQVFRWHHL